jgi:uncharacterized protein
MSLIYIMAWLAELLSNYLFLSFVISWIVSILLKTFFKSLKDGKFDVLSGLKNGGMPSSHSTVVSAITMAVFLSSGPSELFFVSLVFSLIIISDAFGLRQHVGIQGDHINLLSKKLRQDPIDVVYGHTLIQVIIGILIGMVTSILLYIVIF